MHNQPGVVFYYNNIKLKPTVISWVCPSFSFQGTPERKLVAGGDHYGIETNLERDSGIHSGNTLGGSHTPSALPPMDMSVDCGSENYIDGLPQPQFHKEHYPGPLQLARDPSADIPLDPALAESHYLDVDDFEADQSESEVQWCVIF